MDKKYKFQEVYNFPFKADNYIDWVTDANDHFIFQFEKEDLTNEDKNKIVNFLNGKNELKSFLFTKYENGLIYISLDNKTFEPFILIRGYGYLTGIGGLNLPHEEAVEIQDSLAQYILDKIKYNNKQIKNKEIDVDKHSKEIDTENISNVYHTFRELYEFRKIYNAMLFNEFAENKKYDVHKSWKHSDGEWCFGIEKKWFIVVAELPTGQISNHYKTEDWNLFKIPEKEKANSYDGHSNQDVIERMLNFISNKS